MFTDSHCHLDLLSDLPQALNEAKAVGVETILCPGVVLSDVKRILEITSQYNNLYAAIGSHPTEDLDRIITAEEIFDLVNSDKIVAIGETGLDYYERKDDNELSELQKESQKQKFRIHIQVACKLKKPLIIHSRDASLETLQILREEHAEKVGGVFHCFTYNWDIAKKILDLGFYIGISGIITFKNARILQEVVEKAPLDRILLETDAPFLAPDPYRGKPNLPQYVIYIAKKIAEIKKISVESLAEVTTNNFLKGVIKL